MKQQVAIEKLFITKQGEIKHFQTKIPQSAVRIMGIEVGVNNVAPGGYLALGAGGGGGIGPVETSPNPFLDGLKFQGGMFFGELKLQSLEQADIFYAKDVFDDDQNIGYGDFSQTLFFPSFSAFHGLKRTEDPVDISPETTFLYGVFRDRLGESFRTDIPYCVNLYLWYEVEDECENEKATDCTDENK